MNALARLLHDTVFDKRLPLDYRLRAIEGDDEEPDEGDDEEPDEGDDEEPDEGDE